MEGLQLNRASSNAIAELRQTKEEETGGQVIGKGGSGHGSVDERKGPRKRDADTKLAQNRLGRGSAAPVME